VTRRHAFVCCAREPEPVPEPPEPPPDPHPEPAPPPTDPPEPIAALGVDLLRVA
jgi:hypothetical protein